MCIRDSHKTYPKIVGETGGKDFVMVHKSANPKQVATALSRGAFEFQGQKCSAASRAYIPKSLWKEVREHLVADLKSFKMGGVEDFRNFINAVIDEPAFNKISGYIANAKKAVSYTHLRAHETVLDLVCRLLLEKKKKKNTKKKKNKTANNQTQQ